MPDPEICALVDRSRNHPVERMAVGVARRIAQMIMTSGWEVGMRLGTEPDLLRHFAVSRKTFREAVRILEQQDVVRAETGMNGGLIVKAPALAAVSMIVRNHIEMTDISFDEVQEAYAIMLRLGTELAIVRMTPAHANDLRRALGTPSAHRTREIEARQAQSIIRAMMDIAQNPALSALVYMLNQLIADFAHHERYPIAVWREVLDEVGRLNRLLVDQLCMRDPAAVTTIDALLAYVRTVMTRLEKLNPLIWNSRSYLRGQYTSSVVGIDRSRKAALRLSYDIAAKIQRVGLLPGSRLGSERELIAEYRVSPTVVVEALRMLEFLGVIRVRRGRAAGAEVIVPKTTAVIDAAALYLSYYAPAPSDLADLRQRLQRDTLILASRRLSHRQAVAVTEVALDLVAKPTSGRREYADCIQSVFALSGNRATTLLNAILSRMVSAENLRRTPFGGNPAVGSKAIALRGALTETDGSGVYDALTDLVAHLEAAALLFDSSEQNDT